MAGPLELGAQVARIVRVDRRGQRYAPDGLDLTGVRCGDLAGVVRQQQDAVDPEVLEHRTGDRGKSAMSSTTTCRRARAPASP